MPGTTVLIVLLGALAGCVGLPGAAAAVASSRGRDGLVAFLLTFLWGASISGLLGGAVALGATGLLAGALGLGGSLPALLGGLGACLAALLCTALFLLPALLVVVFPARTPPRRGR